MCIRIHFGGIEREESDQSCCCTDQFLNKIKAAALGVISRLDVGLLLSNPNQDKLLSLVCDLIFSIFLSFKFCSCFLFIIFVVL